MDYVIWNISWVCNVLCLLSRESKLPHSDNRLYRTCFFMCLEFYKKKEPLANIAPWEYSMYIYSVMDLACCYCAHIYGRIHHRGRYFPGIMKIPGNVVSPPNISNSLAIIKKRFRLSVIWAWWHLTISCGFHHAMPNRSNNEDVLSTTTALNLTIPG